MMMITLMTMMLELSHPPQRPGSCGRGLEERAQEEQPQPLPHRAALRVHAPGLRPVHDHLRGGRSWGGI